MRKLFAIVLMFLAIKSYSQTAAQYVLVRNNAGTPGSISAASGTVSTTDISDDDEVKTDIPIGFSFVYCGTTYTTLSACSNGWISLANSSSTEWTNSAANIPSSAFLMPFWDDLDGSGCTAYYQTSGTAPNRVFTFQWGIPTAPAANRWGNITGNGRASFQVRLFESSNVVEYAYLFSNYTLNSGTVGISNSSSDYQTLGSTTATTASNSTFTTSLAGIPAANGILDWTPPPTISVSPSSLTFTTAPSVTTAGQLVSLVAYGLTSGSVTVTAPANFQVYNGSTWGTTATINTTAAAVGSYINTTVQVRFVGPATTGTYPGSLTFTSTGATTRTVSLTGNVIPTCTGTPTSGTVSATSTSGSCNPYSPTLSTTGTSSTFGIGYQWQSSSDDISYSDISGATNPTYVPTISGDIYYRAHITCSYTSLSANTSGVLFSYTAPPAAITGSFTVCLGSTVTLSSATGGGTWASSNGSIAAVNASGEVTGAAAGTANITYSKSSCPVIKTVTVSGAPSVISFSPSATGTVCLGSGTAFTASTTAPTATILSQDFNSGMGSWTITNTSGIANSYWQIRTPPGYGFSGVNGDGSPYIQAAPDATTSNTTTIFTSPSFSTVGYSSVTLTYNQEFSSYSGDVTVAVQASINGGTTWANLVNQLGASDPSYSWTAATPQKTVTLPAAALNQPSVMIRWNYNSTFGFYWAVDNIKVTGTSALTYAWTGPSGLSCTTCTNPTITPTATGGNVYTLTATATANGCTRAGNVTVNVNPLPVAIGGNAAVCTGLTTTLTDATPSGTWSSSNSGVASIGSSTGIVTGGTPGTATITYALTTTGCYITRVVTVNALPANITGTASACVGASTTLSDATSSGTWSSGTDAIAAVGSSSGIVSGVSAGLAIITYTAPTTCIKTVEVTINPLPATTVTPGTSIVICPGETTTFTANAPAPAFNILLQDFNSGLGTWTIQNTSGDAGSYWQVTTSAASGASGDGTAMLEANSDEAYVSAVQLTTALVSPSFSTLGYGAATVSFNQYLLSLSSDSHVDVDYSTDNGGTWTTMLSQIGVGSDLPGGGTSVWSAGSPEVTIALPAEALGVSNVKLRWHYDSYAGVQWNIDNIKVTAYQPEATYVWSGALGLSCTGCPTTTIAPAATGVNAYSVTANTSAGCQATTPVTVTVNSLPADIDGSLAVCVNSITTLTNTTTGGTWSSASGNVSVDASSGAVTGVFAGTATVTYTAPTGCVKTAEVTVNPLPDAISGELQVCEGLTTTLSSTTIDGDWSATTSSIATIGSSTGIVEGFSTGTIDVTYTSQATGCSVSANVTVNHTPAAITGVLEVCEGSQTTLDDPDAGGTWASVTTTVADIDETTGVVSASLAGTTNIIYQLPEGCSVNIVVTVNPLPEAITGISQVCEGLTTSLGSITPGGTWGSNGTYTSVDADGMVTGVTAGVETITYQLSTSCLRTTNVTVNPTPGAINGMLEVCEGSTTALDIADAGGTWTSGAASTATVDAVTGVVTGGSAGFATITYTLPSTCFNTADVTVDPLPAAIGGPSQVCVGLSITLTDASGGGTWESSELGTAIIDGDGVLLGMSAGMTTVTYTLPTGCIITKSVTVNPSPEAITGTLQVCEGLTTTLENSTGGGTWSSSTTAVADISATGVVSAFDEGNTTITYTSPTSCVSTAIVTVHPLPAAIDGVKQVCEGLTTTLSDADPDGTWSTSAILTASIDVDGVVSGGAAGTTFVTYTLPTGCAISANVTVHPLPASIGGVKQVCKGLSTSLTDITGTGTWSSGETAIADINSATGEVMAYEAGNAPISYTLPTGCTATTEITVNPLPSAIGGTPQVCLAGTRVLTNLSPGGTWTSSAPGVASVNAVTGVVSGVAIGNTTITYTLPTGCLMTTGLAVSPLPAPITGPSQMCAADVSAFADGSAGGTWSSSTPLVASVDNATGEVTANASGTTLITYTLTTGCLRTRPMTVNALPGAITGSMQLCQSRTATLSNSVAGGLWSSLDPAIATINSAGVVTGVTAGTAQVAYRLSTGCAATAIVTVDVMPSILTSGAVVCQGQTVTLPTSVPGGSWLSGASTVASVDAAGAVTGMGTGSAYISYIMPTGCTASIPVAVNEMPVAISGASSVCQGSTMVLTNASSAGVWTSSVTGVASINFTTGVVTGLAAGTANISYTMPSGGCFVTHTITVNPMPAAFTGSPVVCNGQTTTLSSSSTGGTWSSNNPSVAAITSGVVSGISAGTSNVTYELASGCMRSTTVIVNALPEAYNVTGGGTYCPGGAGVHIGLDNSNGGAAYQLYSGTTPVGGAVTGVSGLPVDFGMIGAGSYSVVATSAINGCSSSMTGTATVLMASSVPAYVDFSTASGSDTVCSGAPVAFTATATNGGITPVYEWQVNGVTVSGAGSNVYTYTPSNGDVVTVNMESSVMCATPTVATAARTVTVKTSVMPVAGISVTPGSTSCQGEPVTFSASALYGGSTPVFMWMKNGALATTGATYSYTPVNGDVVYVKLVSNQGCRLADQVSSSDVEMTVNPVYNPTVTITADPGVTVQVGTSVTLTANVTNGGPSPAYQWYIGTSAIAGATDATFTNNTFSGGDSVSCIVTGTGACGTAGQSSVIMHIGGVGIAMPTAYGDIRLVPNPNKGEFAVKGTLPVADDKEVAIEVTNMLGQVVYRSGVIARNGNVEAQVKLDNTLANGMYMLNMVSGENRRVIHFVLEQ